MKLNLKPKTASYEAHADEIEHVLLLYSGGLDTSVMLKWIPENYNCKVSTLIVDLGQPTEDLGEIVQKALLLGAENSYCADAKEEFADNYISKAIKANALYQGKYPLSTALGRPLISKLAIEYAEKCGADAIAHGSTGKGNDQVRLDAGIISLNPALKIIAPVREWNMPRDEEIKYAEEHGIPISVSSKKPYSTDENLWGKSSECGVLENPNTEPPEDVFEFVTLPHKAPEKSEYVEISFEKGIPVSLNGIEMELHKLISELNSIAASHGIGIIDHMEDRIVGLKSREIYECPAATCILEAHKDLEKYTSTIHENHFKTIIDNQWSYMVYAGLWFDPLLENLNAFISQMNKNVSGTVKLKLYKGNVLVVARDYDKTL